MGMRFTSTNTSVF